MKRIKYANKEISQMTLGTVQLGFRYGLSNKIGQPSVEQAKEIIAAADAAGINCLDTARLYGTSEEVLGTILPDYPGMVLVSKFRIERDEGVDESSIRKQIKASLKTSLQTLGKDKLDVFMMHSTDDLIDFGDKITNALRDLRDDGLFDIAGGSVYHEKHIDALLENDLYKAVQLPINILDHRLIKNGRLNMLKDHGFLVFARSVFMQGLLLADEILPELEITVPYIDGLKKIAANHNMSLSQLAISFVRDLETISSLVIGAEAPEQVLDSAKQIDTPPLSHETQNEIDELVADIPLDEIMEVIIVTGRKYAPKP